MESNIIELVLGEAAHGGTCVSRDSHGRVIFVRFGLPGETVRAIVTKEQANFAWAEVVEVLEPSPDRVEGDLVRHLNNLGVDLAHVNLSAARTWKRRVLNSVLRRIGGDSLYGRVQELYGPDGPPLLSAPSDEDTEFAAGSRTRARFIVDDQGRLGMREYRSSKIVPVREYPLIDSRFEDAQLFTGGPRNDAWRSRWQPGDTVTLVAPNASEPLVVAGQKKPGSWTLDGKRSDQPTRWKVRANGAEATFEVKPTDFWQVHPDAPKSLVEAVLEAAMPLAGANVLELYSGAGLFSYFLAAKIGSDGKLITLEGSKSSVVAAEKNLRPLNQTGNVEFFRGRVDASAIHELAEHVNGNIDVVLLDPPRVGAKQKVVSAVAETGTQKIILVSCDPAAGARDLAGFRELGYELEELQAWDLFPHTHHFEMVGVLVRSLS